jgi:biopolymer transport protein ExbD
MLNTTALADLIFTLLLFFMLTVDMRTAPSPEQVQLPQTEILQPLKDKIPSISITIRKTENGATVQLDSLPTTASALPSLLVSRISRTAPEDRNKLVAILQIDRATPMGTVHNIRRILRQANLPLIYYAAEKPH